MQSLCLKVMEETFAIHRLPPNGAVPPVVYECDFYAICKTAEELSIVAPKEVEIGSERTEVDWAGMQVVGPLDFGLTGILAELSTALAAVDITLFAISTYDTDYILVKIAELARTRQVLEGRGHRFE